jgi:hypothetical protein
MAETPEGYREIESPEYHRKVGEVVVGGVLRAFSDPGGVKQQAGSVRGDRGVYRATRQGPEDGRSRRP